MKFLYPPDKTRLEVTSRLRQFFKTEEVEFFNAALNLFAGFYEIEKPMVTWYLRLDDVKVAGLTYSSGKIELIDPSAWKKNRKHRGVRRWLEVCYHELYHYLFWVQDEAKADEFAKGMLRK